MDTIGRILEEKGHHVHAISPEATVLSAVDQMCAHHIGALLVATADETLGIISERDVLTRVILERREPALTRVERVMTRAIACIDVDDHVETAMAVMTERRCRHLPVVCGARIVGVVSIGDLVRWASREKEIEIRLLTEYVQGSYH
jgi:signal-transduction protein with cAMP-binding, CBS, and nucleotidyltransferase domain